MLFAGVRCCLLLRVNVYRCLLCVVRCNMVFVVCWVLNDVPCVLSVVRCSAFVV